MLLRDNNPRLAGEKPCLGLIVEASGTAPFHWSECITWLVLSRNPSRDDSINLPSSEQLFISRAECTRPLACHSLPQVGVLNVRDRHSPVPYSHSQSSQNHFFFFLKIEGMVACTWKTTNGPSSGAHDTSKGLECVKYGFECHLQQF